MRESQYLDGNKNLIHRMRKIPTLSPFRVEDLESLLRNSKIRTYAPDELIFEEGSQETWLFFIISGKVKVMKQGKELAILKRMGDIFGEMGIIDGSARSASVYAVDETVCLAADASDVDKLPGTDRLAFGYVLYRLFSNILAIRLRLTNEELIKERDEGEELQFEWGK